MGFWGIEVKPGKSYPYHADNVQGKLHITQATLGLGAATEKSILQCSAGRKNPVFLCSLQPNNTESCPLNLQFDEDDVVVFSVIGPQSIHLSGFFAAADGDGLRDDYEYDSFGEDNSETEGSSEYNTEDEYMDGFIDDSDIDSYPPSPLPNSGVVIEEIVDDDDKPESENNASKKANKKVQMPKSKEDKNSHQQIVKGHNGVPVLESEDEDGFPISASLKEEQEGEKTHEKIENTNKKKVKDDVRAATLKRKVEDVGKEENLEGKKKKKKKQKEQSKIEIANISDDCNETHLAGDECEGNVSNGKNIDEKKKKKKKKNKKTKDEGATNANQTLTGLGNKNLSTSEHEEEEIEAKPSQTRTYPNGLVVEELSMGKPDGKRASGGKQVSVRYIGKLKKSGKIFDSNIGRAPFKFRLGIGQVIKGWDIGVNGMRVGDKRRITIPPSMGYGDKRAGSIPPNSWLVFDVELINVS